MFTGPGDKPVARAKPKKKAPDAPAYQPPSAAGKDTKSNADRSRADVFKKTKAYRGAVRAGYGGSQDRKRALADNIATARTGEATTEQQTVFKTHSDAVRGNQKNAASSAGKDTKGNDDRQRALQFLADHPGILNPKKKGRGSGPLGIPGFLDDALSGKLSAGAINLAHEGVDIAAPLMLGAVRGPIGFIGDKVIHGVGGPDVGKALSKEGKAAGKDIVDTPANAVPSLYVPSREAVAAGVELAKGKPDEAWSHTKKAGVSVGDPFVQAAKHPLKSLADHPVNTVLLARGAEGAIGHGIGKALRTAPSETLRKAGSIERGTVEIPNARTNIREDRTYSKDAIVMAGQKLRDRRRATQGKEPVKGHVTEADVATRANERVAMDEDVRRANRASVVHEARTILDQRGPVAKVKGHRPSAATTAMAQHIADTPAELATYLGALKEAARGLEGDKLRRNKQTQAQIEKALKHPGRLARNGEQAAKYRDLSNSIQDELAKTGIIDPKQMEQRRLLSYATSPAKGMNARMLTPEETKAHVETAAKTRDKAKRAVKSTSRDLTKAREAEAAAAGAGVGVAAATSRRVAAEAAAKDAASHLKHTTKQLAKVRKVHQQGGHLVDEHGVKVTSAAIRGHMAMTGVMDEGAYVTHAPGKRGARNFYVDPTKAQGYFGPKATGAAVKEGTLDLHPETMVEGVAHAQGLVDSIHRFRGMIDEFAHRKVNGEVKRYKSFQDAIDAAREMMVGKDGAPIPHALEMRPVRINPLGGRAEQLRATLESVDHASAAKHINEAIDEALSGNDTGAGEWALIPAKAAETVRAHTAKVGATTAGKVGQLYGSQFRKVVLSLSPKWLTGNVAEAALRSLVGHSGVRSYYTGRAVQKRYEELHGAEAAAELRSRTTGGGHYSLASRTDVRRTAEDIAQAGGSIARFAESMGKLRRAPVAKQLVDAWDGYTHIVMQSLNGRIEHQFQTAMFGKALRDHPLMSDHTVKLSKAALDDAAKGLTDTTAQVRLGREVDRMYGKYSKFSPGQRRLIAGYTPFIAWSLNTVRFLFDTLPRDHPVLTSVIASANIATEDWRKHHGLVMSFFENMAGGKPSFLQGSIPGNDDSSLRISHVTPFGIYDQEGGLLGAFAGALLPQAQGVLSNIQGKDWRDKSLTGTDRTKTPTQARDLLAAAFTVLENSVPLLSQGVDAAGIHAPNEADGTKHPPSLGARLRKRNDPFMYSQSGQGGGSTHTIKDILSGKVPLPTPSELPPLPKTITFSVH